MRDRDVDLAILLVQKEVLLMDHQLGLALWHGVEVAGLAVPGLAAIGFLQGTLSETALAGAALVAFGFVVLGELGAAWKRKRFRARLRLVVDAMERLKSGGEP